MNILEKLKERRLSARKAQDSKLVTFYSTMIGEIERFDVEKRTDSNVIQLFKKMVKNNYGGFETKDNLWEVPLIEEFIPTQLTKEEIKGIISTLENKTVGAVMKHFSQTYPDRHDKELIKECLT